MRLARLSALTALLGLAACVDSPTPAQRLEGYRLLTGDLPAQDYFSYEYQAFGIEPSKRRPPPSPGVGVWGYQPLGNPLVGRWGVRKLEDCIVGPSGDILCP